MVSMSASPSLDIEQVIKTLSVHQIIRLLGGKSFFNLGSVEEAGIPSLAVSDGPNGIRGNQVWNPIPAAVFPCGPGLAASFDVSLVKAVGDSIGREGRAKHTHVLMGPTSNIPRSPLGGRNFESFSEDPLLSGMLAAALINGVQAQKAAICSKHYAANDQEYQRWSINAVVPKRALREIYLEPFRLIVRHSNPQSMMTAYNMVNGIHVSEDEYLLKTILREEWGYEGCLISDWTGVYSTLKSLKAGCDIEMPGPPVMRGEQTYRLIHAGKLTEADIDERMRPILRLIKYGQESGIPFEGRGQALDTLQARQLMRDTAAEAVVLLKNDKNLLPLDLQALKSIAIIGVSARDLVYSGGGSAELLPFFKTSLLDAATAECEAIGTAINFADGVHPYSTVPVADRYCHHPEGATFDLAKVEFWRTSPSGEWWDNKKPLAPCDWQTGTATMFGFIIDELPRKQLGNNPCIKISTVLVPDGSGDWELSLCSVGTSRLYLDGMLVLDNTTDYARGSKFVGLGSKEVRATVKQLRAGVRYNVEIRVLNDQTHRAAPPPEIPGGFRFGALRVATPQSLLDDAVRAAKASDIAVVVVGNNQDWESEGFDRSTMSLPPGCDELVSAVLGANPKTIVVTQSGCAIAMPWVTQAPTLLHAFFGGSAGGQGLWDVLTGKINPSSRLPVTFPFGATSLVPGKVMYDEGIFVGYRHYNKAGIEPNFAFGHGLSYTTFDIGSLRVQPESQAGRYLATCIVTNSGSLAGKEVVQVYITASQPTSQIDRPTVELAGFAKVALNPGESKSVAITIDKKAFSYWSEDEDCWIAQKGEYLITAGRDMHTLSLKQKVDLKEDIRWRGLG